MKTIFIGGTGRSGTNITKKILTQHPDVAALPFEHRFLIDPEGIVDFYNSFSKNWSPYYSDYKIKKLRKFLINLANRNSFHFFISKLIKKMDKKGRFITPHNYYGWELERWFPNYTKHVNDLINELTDFTYQSIWPGSESYKKNNITFFSSYKEKEKLAIILNKFIENLIHHFLFVKKKSVFVEDNTWNILFAKELSELVPNFKLLHIIRDPRDVIASMKNQKWCPSELDQAIMFYKGIVDKWIHIKENLNKSSYLEIKFENLIHNPKESIERICNFSGINYSEYMLNIDLSRSNINRWEKDFSEEDKKMINIELNDYLKHLDYK